MKTKYALMAAVLALAVSAPAETPVTPSGGIETGAVAVAQGQRHKHHGKTKRHRREKYIVTDFDVFYGGRKVEGASAMSFKVLGRGYAKDDFEVYYKGKKIEDASAMSFEVLDGGYAKDDFGAYYKGKKIAGASAMTFRVLEDGYAKDDFDTYYKGRKISN